MVVTTDDDPVLAERVGEGVGRWIWDNKQRFDVNDQGHLSHYEVGEMMRDMGYKVDTDYVRSVMEMFSSGARKQPLSI